MPPKKPALGRNLGALLGDVTASKTNIEAVDSNDAALQNITLSKIIPGEYQPRRDMDPTALQELADSIKAQGIIQPIVVRKKPAGKFELIAGERRWRAANLAGLKEIPAVVRELDDEVAMVLGLIENVQRENLNPIDEALALSRLVEEFSMTHQQVSEAVGKSRTAVSNALRLLGLQDEVKRLLAHGDLEMGHARALLSLEPNQQIEVARIVAEQGMSVRETEELVRSLGDGEVAKPTAKTKVVDPDIERLQSRLSNSLGAKVAIAHKPNGKGKLTIKYSSLEQLDSILELLDS